MPAAHDIGVIHSRAAPQQQPIELCGRTCAESGRAEVFCGDFARAFSAVASTTARLYGVAGLLR
jgi:hypothetical protein